MSRREDIDNAIWSDPDFEALSLPATCLYLWSFTNPRCGMAGLYKVSHRAMTESKVPAENIPGALEELAQARFLYYEDGVLFVRSRVKHMRQRTLQIAKSIRTDLAKIPAGHPMRERWIEENGSAPWIVRQLGDPDWHLFAVPDGDPHMTVDGHSGEARQKGPLGPNKRGSREGRSTLLGNGNGKGTGNGPLGRGAGREPTARERFEELVHTEYPGVTVEDAIICKRSLDAELGRTANIEELRAQLVRDGLLDERQAA